MPASDLARQLFEQMSTGTAATLPAELRTAIVQIATARITGAEPPELPAAIVPLVDKITDHMTSVSHADLLALLDAGYDEDGVFEICTAASVGADRNGATATTPTNAARVSADENRPKRHCAAALDPEKMDAMHLPLSPSRMVSLGNWSRK